MSRYGAVLGPGLASSGIVVVGFEGNVKAVVCLKYLGGKHSGKTRQISCSSKNRRIFTAAQKGRHRRNQLLEKI